MATSGRTAAWTIALAGAVASIAIGPRAHADEPAPPEHAPAAADLDEARRLFREAVEADRALDPARALELYRRARAIAFSPQIDFNIGSCEERLGRLISAAQSYRAAQALASERHLDDVEREAKARIAHLEAITPRVRIVLPADAEGIDVRLDDAPLLLGDDAIRVDPGEHRLVARSPDERVFELAFRANEREERKIEVRFPTGTGPAQEALPGRIVVVSPPPSYVPAVIAGGATVVLGTVAAVTFGAGRSKKDRFDNLNTAPTPGTEEERSQLRDDGRALYVASTIFGVSAALAATATVTLFVRAYLARNKRAPAAAMWVAPSTSGLRLGGSF